MVARPQMPADLDDEALLRAADDLADLWRQWVGAGSIYLKPRRDFPKTQRQAAVLITHTQHLHHLISVVRPHLPGGLPIELVPVAREALETGIWILWVDRFDDSAEVAINEAERNRKNLTQTMIESSLLPAGVPLNVPDWTRLESPSANHIRSLLNMTEALKLPELYAFYRIFSQLSHPGVEIADEYVENGNEGQPRFRDTSKPLRFESMLATRVLPLLMLKATRIVTYLTNDRNQRREVRNIARELLVDVDALFKHL